MRLKFIVVVLFMATVVAALPARQAGPAQLAFEAARSREVVDRDLPGAIALYRDVVSTFGSDRAVAAEALLRMAGCLEQLGKPEAQATYELIVKEYGTTTAAATARAKLAAMEQKGAGAMSQQRIGDFPGDAISPDGRYTTFTDKNGDLVAHDLASGRDSVLTTNWKEPPGCEVADMAVPSPDSQLIAYACNSRALHRFELRVIARTGGQSRLVHPPEATATGVWPHSWSPDGKWIVATLELAVAPRAPCDLVLIPAAGGPARVITQFPNGFGVHFTMSADGNSIVYERPAVAGNPRRGLFSVSIDGGPEVPLFGQAANDQLLGWLPGNDRILFQSDRGATHGIWTARVVDGRVQGEPLLIRPEPGRVSGYGFTARGDFYYRTTVSQDEVYVAALDPATGKQVGPLARLESRLTGFKLQAAWSPLGDRIAYVQPAFTAVLGPARDQKLAIQTISSGALDLKTVALQNMQNPAWLPDGRGVVVQGRDLAGGQGLHIVEIETGTVTSIGREPADDSRRMLAALSPEGRVFFKWVSRTGSDEGGIAARGLASGGEERITTQAVGTFALSPDGKWLATTRSADRPDPSVFVIPSSGGEPRRLAAPAADVSISESAVAWSSDGRFVFVVKDGKPAQEIWQVPVDGSAPRDTGFRWSGSITRISAHPDGRRLAISTSGTSSETWILRNLTAAAR